MWDPIYIDATVIGDEFTENQVELFFYEEMSYTNPNIQSSPANIETQLLIPVDFKRNDMNKVLKYASPSCKFTYGTKVATSEGQIIAYPFEVETTANNANSIHCKTPKWSLDSNSDEKVTLDISINGQNYGGGLEFTFTSNLVLHRDVPMSGPSKSDTLVRLIGQGFNPKQAEASVKWGVDSTSVIKQIQVQDFSYNNAEFLDLVYGAEHLRAYQSETNHISKVDSVLTEGTTYDQVKLNANLISDSNSIRGPEYLEVGIEEHMEYKSADSSIQKFSVFSFNPSAVEFFKFREPYVKAMYPNSGLTQGGTLVEVIGAWFMYKPEYGVVPHCRFGDKIVRAFFDSSVRLICQSPPNSDTSVRLPIEVSLNGVDWTETGFTFSYYDQPVMTDIEPDMGSVIGGEDIYIRGEKFSNITDPNQFLCRFTPTTLHIPPKIVRARFINSTTILCTSPGGWSEADKIIL